MMGYDTSRKFRSHTTLPVALLTVPEAAPVPTNARILDSHSGISSVYKVPEVVRAG